MHLLVQNTIIVFLRINNNINPLSCFNKASSWFVTYWTLKLKCIIPSDLWWQGVLRFYKFTINIRVMLPRRSLIIYQMDNGNRILIILAVTKQCHI